MTGSTPARLYQLRSKMTTSPAAGKCSTYRCMYICDFCRSVGAGSATTRKTRGLTRSTMRLIVPPLPAVSRPSNTMHTLAPVALTHSCMATSSAWSRASSASYLLRPSFAPPSGPCPSAVARAGGGAAVELSSWCFFLDFLPMAGLRRDAVARCARCHHTSFGVRCHHPYRGSRRAVRYPVRGQDAQKPRSRAGDLGFAACAPEGIRTPNLLIRSQMLYPLSYRRRNSGSLACVPLTGEIGRPQWSTGAVRNFCSSRTRSTRARVRGPPYRWSLRVSATADASVRTCADGGSRCSR